MRRPWEIDRRALLRGTGAAIGLPFLEAMVPGLKRAQAATPKRLLFFVVTGGTPDTTGINNEGAPGSLYPGQTGKLPGALPPILQPFDDYGVRDDILIVGNLHNSIGRVGTELIRQGGDHSRLPVSLLTQTNPEWIGGGGGPVKAGISVDQVAANSLKGVTSLPSLCVTVGGPADLCWTSPTSVKRLFAPSEAFAAVYGTNVDPKVLKKRNAYAKRVVDFVRDDTLRLQMKLGKADRETLGNYLASIDDLEQNIASSEKNATVACGTPGGAPNNAVPLDAQLKQAMDLVANAFACDRTRVAVICLPTYDQTYDWLGEPYDQYGWHGDIQHGQQADRGFTPDEYKTRLDAYVKACTWSTGQFAYLANKLKQSAGPDGSILKNSAMLMTSEMSYGNGHSDIRIPAILAGQAGSAINTGRYINPKVQPLSNLYLAMLSAVGATDRQGAPITTFGQNSTGLADLS